MTQDKRKSNRHNRFLPISLQAINSNTSEVIAGPYQGRVLNISRHGVCLYMPQIASNSFHMFHSIKENDIMCLQLTINIQPEIINCKIPGQPVWMNSFREGDIHAFKIGIEFTCDTENDGMLQLEQIVKNR